MPAARRFAIEILKRPSLRANSPLVMSAYQVMVRVTEDANESLDYIDQARKLSDELKQSTAAGISKNSRSALLAAKHPKSLN